jgi:hypothetical protein
MIKIVPYMVNKPVLFMRKLRKRDTVIITELAVHGRKKVKIAREQILYLIPSAPNITTAEGEKRQHRSILKS